jgi:hypothetical protein
MKTLPLQAPSDVRRSRTKAKLYIETHEQMYRETEESRIHRECVAELASVFAAADFSEVN